MFIDVPYRSQEDPDAKAYRNDCGAACAGMVIEWVIGAHLSTNSLSEQTTLVTRDTGLSCSQVASLLGRHNVQSSVQAGATVDKITAWLDAGKPIIALINYGAVSDRQNQADHFGHFVVVVGHDGFCIYVNDPDFWGVHRDAGMHLAVKREDFAKAIDTSPAPGQVVLVESGCIAAVFGLLQGAQAGDRVQVAVREKAEYCDARSLGVALGVSYQEAK